MALIKSISGIRGTIGGFPGESFTPPDIVAFVSAYALWIKEASHSKKSKVVLGRDARPTGPMVEKLVSATLSAMGVDVINLGMASTPTVELAVTGLQAEGGIILTASHNPVNWNALKLLNAKGEFISDEEGRKIVDFAGKGLFEYAGFDSLGSIIEHEGYDDEHIRVVLNLPLVNTEAIRKAEFKVVIDAVNSVGGIIIPKLLRKLGVSEVVELHCEPHGIFAHNPEPLPENLSEISDMVKESKADVGFVVDPDVDRLAIVSEDGTFFGEEYTLVAVADYVLSKTPGNTASNLSSTRALKDITLNYGTEYYASPVGEVNVVEVMKKHHCIIGGEGNGGVIYPEAHYGRDALVGIALFLSMLAERKTKVSVLRNSYPDYIMIKEKVNLTENTNIEDILVSLRNEFKDQPVNDSDGLKIDFDDGWVHLRKSNTEPIIRLYIEARDIHTARNYSAWIRKVVNRFFE